MQGEAMLYTDAVVTAPFALAMIAKAADSRVVGSRCADPHVLLFGGPASARVEVAAFGDSVPVTVDVRDERGVAQARAAAQALGRALRASAGWRVTAGF